LNCSEKTTQLSSLYGTLSFHQLKLYVFLLSRHGSDCDLADARVVDADIWCAQGAAEAPLPHVWPHHGRHQQKRGGQEAREGRQHSRGHTGQAARPLTGNVF